MFVVLVAQQVWSPTPVIRTQICFLTFVARLSFSFPHIHCHIRSLMKRSCYKCHHLKMKLWKVISINSLSLLGCLGSEENAEEDKKQRYETRWLPTLWLQLLVLSEQTELFFHCDVFLFIVLQVTSLINFSFYSTGLHNTPSCRPFSCSPNKNYIKTNEWIISHKNKRIVSGGVWRSLAAWGETLLCSLVVQQRRLHLPDGSRVTRLLLRCVLASFGLTSPHRYH